MDRGWTIGDIGHRLTWWDVKTFIQGLPPDSHLKRHWNPDQYLPYVLHKPENQILGQIHDQIQAYPYIRAGKGKDIPQGIIQYWLEKQIEQKRESEKKNLSAAEIRAAVSASMRR